MISPKHSVFNSTWSHLQRRLEAMALTVLTSRLMSRDTLWRFGEKAPGKCMIS